MFHTVLLKHLHFRWQRLSLPLRRCGVKKHHWAILIPVLNQIHTWVRLKGCLKVVHKQNNNKKDPTKTRWFLFHFEFFSLIPVFAVYDSTIRHSGGHDTANTAAEETNGPYCSRSRTNRELDTRTQMEHSPAEVLFWWDFNVSHLLACFWIWTVKKVSSPILSYLNDRCWDNLRLL